MQLLNDVPLLPSAGACRVVSGRAISSCLLQGVTVQHTRSIEFCQPQNVAAQIDCVYWFIYHKMWHRFRSCRNLKPLPKFALRLYSVHCTSRTTRETPKPNTTSFKHLCLLLHANPSAMIYASLICATLLKGRSALSAQYTSVELVCLSICVYACKFIDMGLNLIWTVAPIRDAHTCNNCNILFTLAASLSFVFVRNILIASQTLRK